MKETYDFHSLPLWVKENTVLPWGGTDDTAAYDYSDSVQLRAYQVNQPVRVIIPGQDGTQALAIDVYRKDGQLVCDPPGGHTLRDMGS